MTAAIQVAGLTKFYGRRPRHRGARPAGRARRGLRLSSARTAPGKTTTIRLLLDLIRPTRGTRRGSPGSTPSAQSVEVRRLTGYLPGELKPPAQSTAIGYLSYLGRLRGGVDRRAIERARRAASSSTSSAGSATSRRATSRRWASSPPSCTTPSCSSSTSRPAGSTPFASRTCSTSSASGPPPGRTVFLSSHELDQVEHVAERVGIVRDGRLVAVEAIAALKQRAAAQGRGPPRRSGRGRRRPARGAGRAGRSLVDGDVVRLEVAGVDGRRSSRSWRSFPVQTLTSEPPELDEIFLSYYGRAACG